MKKTLYTWATIVVIVAVTFLVLAVTSGSAHADDDVERARPVVTVYVDKPVYVDRIVYVDRPVDRIVTNVVTRDVPVEKIVYVEKPVYETDPVTSDTKTIRAMMKVTHDRYLALLAKYRALKPRR